MTAIIKRLLALATAFTLALNLVGCGGNVTSVSLNLPDTIEKGTTLVATPEYAFDGTAQRHHDGRCQPAHRRIAAYVRERHEQWSRTDAAQTDCRRAYQADGQCSP